jgi:hypothetical protein
MTSVSCQEVLDQNKGHFKVKRFLICNFHKPDIASLPAGLFSTPTKLSWRHACIYPLLADLFIIPMGLQALPTALSIIYFVSFLLQRYIVERGDAENRDILTYFFFLDLIRIF